MNLNRVSFGYKLFSLIFCCLFGVLMLLSSCEEEKYQPEVTSNKTLFMYFPWSGDRNALTDYFQTNISGMEQAIAEHGLNGERVIVFLSTTSSEAEMFEITCVDGKCKRSVLKKYEMPKLTTRDGLSTILNDMKQFAPARSYAMTIGCHGMGWVPTKGTNTLRRNIPEKLYWMYEGVPLTRYFGGTSVAYQTDIKTLADALVASELHMEYILFDDCYMSCIEVAYELRHVVDYLIASPCEMMAAGMPYTLIGNYLLGEPNYEAICEEFYAFYSSYVYPYGTLAVTNCSELDAMAEIMKEINNRYSLDPSLMGDLQSLDGYYPTIFYDYGDYVRHLCPDADLLQQFETQLNLTVPYKVHTDKYFTMSRGTYMIRTFSGLTVSDPSLNELAADKSQTSWWKATH